MNKTLEELGFEREEPISKIIFYGLKKTYASGGYFYTIRIWFFLDKKTYSIDCGRNGYIDKELHEAINLEIERLGWWKNEN